MRRCRRRFDETTIKNNACVLDKERLASVRVNALQGFVDFLFLDTLPIAERQLGILLGKGVHHDMRHEASGFVVPPGFCAEDADNALRYLLLCGKSCGLVLF